ncbi:MAG: YceI family protein [Deinococcota bacterium]|nr:YceI family protein [Deinococcota bacterium]
MNMTIDPSHSNIEFAVRHMAIATVRGRFKNLTGTIEMAEDGSLTGVDAVIEASSIDTSESNRDAHLRSPDFFDADTYPELRFKSTAIEATAEGSYRVVGDLTMHGQTRPVTLAVETSSPITDPWGNKRAAAQATGKLNRKDWGLTWNQVLEMGALLVSEEVRFNFDVQAVAPQAVTA